MELESSGEVKGKSRLIADLRAVPFCSAKQAVESRPRPAGRPSTCLVTSSTRPITEEDTSNDFLLGVEGDRLLR